MHISTRFLIEQNTHTECSVIHGVGQVPERTDAAWYMAISRLARVLAYSLKQSLLQDSLASKKSMIWSWISSSRALWNPRQSWTCPVARVWWLEGTWSEVSARGCKQSMHVGLANRASMDFRGVCKCTEWKNWGIGKTQLRLHVDENEHICWWWRCW